MNISSLHDQIRDTCCTNNGELLDLAVQFN